MTPASGSRPGSSAGPRTGTPDGSPAAPSAESLRATRVVAAQRWRVAIVLTSGMVLVYFGFISLVAFAPAWLGELVTDGVSIGIVLGACVIASAWILTYLYVSWANRRYDPALAALRERHRQADQRDGATPRAGA